MTGRTILPWLVRSAYTVVPTPLPLTRASPYLDTSTSLVRTRDVSVYTPGQNDIGQDPGKHFLEPTSSLQYVLVSTPTLGKICARKLLIPRSDTLEQIDISHQLMHKYSDLRIGHTLMRRGKISALVGIEGGHQLGNSLGALRQFAARGVRYVTV
ncbi:hypothetical protein EDB86DRAFT_3076621 [Lactarius hatsudake]|nr:hypothetical protein EDB86DRAFT_3076621 [Lactarius hatsudake]